MVYAGSSSDFDAVDPNTFPVQLKGAYAKLGRGPVTISSGGTDERISWSMPYGSGTATFSNSSDPESTVTFSEPGSKVLRLTAFERFCGDSNDHYDSVSLTILEPADCAGYLALGGDPGDLNDDCDVDDLDLRTVGLNWLNLSYP